MDTFFEQLVAIRKTAKTWGLICGIVILAIVLVFLVILFLGSLAFLPAIGICYGAYKLYSMLLLEYEYIITNGTMDIDKIIAKSSRKRELSFELSMVQSVEKYNAKLPVGDFKKILIACNPNDENAYYMVIVQEGKGKQLLVISPDDRMKKAMVNFLPKHIANGAFDK